MSKLASSELKPTPNQRLYMEMLGQRSYEEEEQVTAVEVVQDSWIAPMMAYLTDGVVPEDRTEARKIRVKAPRYVIQDGALYKRGYLQPLLKCVEIPEGKSLIREIHEGPNGSHQGARTTAKRILRLGYY